MALGKKGQQLRLFMDPEQHIASVQHSIDGPMRTPEQRLALWGMKEAEARAPISSHVHGAGIYDSIKEKGLTTHVTVVEQHDGSWTHGEGHHRTAAAAAVQRDTGKPQFLPVSYVPNDAHRYPGVRAEGFARDSDFDDKQMAVHVANSEAARKKKQEGKRKAMGL